MAEDPGEQNNVAGYNFMDNMDDDDLNGDEDICRVCRLSGEDTLYHPCLCTGTIKFVHQKCLEQWLKYSKKEVCELCNYRFSFQPVYASNMPERLPIRDLMSGVSVMGLKTCQLCLTYGLVAFCWLFFVPVMACRINKMVFSGFFNYLVSLRLLQFFSLENIVEDQAKGAVIFCIFVCTFIALVWLREQIAVGGPQDMVNIEQEDREDNAEPANIQIPAVERAFDLNEDDNVDNVVDVLREEEDGQNGQNDENWGRDVERIVEDMTWQRLIGLDGSFVFLENVFWAISLNLAFNLVFLYFPFCCGRMILYLLGVQAPLPFFDNPINIFTGYVAIATVLYLNLLICRQFTLNILYSVTGTAYLMVKVFLLITMELFIFPTVCGWWLDICSLSLTGNTLDARIRAFQNYPTSSVVLHWLAGMLYVFYSASLILTLRGLLRPGVLWFIRNLNDPEFNPIQEMIDQPAIKHFRRLIASTSLFLSIIFLIVYAPLRVVKLIVPSILPYSFRSSDAPLSEFSMELLLLQVVLPTILENAKAYNVLKFIVRFWCETVGRMLKLDNYLLPNDDTEDQGNQNRPANNDRREGNNPQDLAARHHAMLMIREPVNIQTYERPDNFQLRLTALIGCLALTLVLFASLCFVVPVSIGRLLLGLVGLGRSIHETYTVGCGIYACWLLVKGCLIWRDWFQKGWTYMKSASRTTVFLALKLLAASVPMVGIVPYLMGLYFQLLVISPFRASIGQTPLFFPWKEWAMGIIHLKIVCTLIMMGPDSRIKTAFEQVGNGGLRNFSLKVLCMDIALPMINMLSFLIAAPYVFSHVLIAIGRLSAEEEVLLIRMSYPAFLALLIFVSYLRWQWGKLKVICQKIRNDKYLIGTKLVNFYRDS
ncbi:unnamed protein product [Bursaphelenchus okinawaensis]|uniref:RING-type E3 ubiquitin transferase n=1 Tax=Bursaphelenchus okinawaensis TaxID=465554 RepID=A0A811JTB1_9BILA|nr:unnamed protein product [Bursaphelenchus okinawaensis]CAG9082076.1 unnamed protein product [Bursaphelenchus okinawaensis]